MCHEDIHCSGARDARHKGRLKLTNTLQHRRHGGQDRGGVLSACSVRGRQSKRGDAGSHERFNLNLIALDVAILGENHPASLADGLDPRFIAYILLKMCAVQFHYKPGGAQSVGHNPGAQASVDEEYGLLRRLR